MLSPFCVSRFDDVSSRSLFILGHPHNSGGGTKTLWRKHFCHFDGRKHFEMRRISPMLPTFENALGR